MNTLEVTDQQSPQVARVSVAFGTGTVEVRPVNGTFIAHFVHPIGWQAPDNIEVPVVRAYDSSGALLPTAPISSDDCYKDSSGRVIYGPARDPARCQAALPWRR